MKIVSFVNAAMDGGREELIKVMLTRVPGADKPRVASREVVELANTSKGERSKLGPEAETVEEARRKADKAVQSIQFINE